MNRTRLAGLTLAALVAGCSYTGSPGELGNPRGPETPEGARDPELPERGAGPIDDDFELAVEASLPRPQRGPDGSFPSRLAWGSRSLLLNGTGLCEWGLFGFNLYFAALYCDRRIESASGAFEPDQRTVIHLHFVRSLSATQLAEAFTAATRANTGDRFAEYEAPLERLNALMESVRDGDAYSFCGAPGAGTIVLRNGNEVGRVEDEAFRRLFVLLYLGDNPPTKALRDGLLGKQR